MDIIGLDSSVWLWLLGTRKLRTWGGVSLNKSSRSKRGVLVWFYCFNLLLKSEEKREYLFVEQKNPEILKNQPYDIPAMKRMLRFL